MKSEENPEYFPDMGFPTPRELEQSFVPAFPDDPTLRAIKLIESTAHDVRLLTSLGWRSKIVELNGDYEAPWYARILGLKIKPTWLRGHSKVVYEYLVEKGFKIDVGHTGTITIYW